LSTNGSFDAGVSALDPFVDIVYVDNDTVEYARSINSGLTYLPPVALSAAGGFYEEPRVARGPSGLVAVAWIDATDILKYRVRVSTDGGVSFGAVKTFSANLNFAYESIAVAAGAGVVYVGYAATDTKLVSRRSTDGGASWGAAITATNAYVGQDAVSLVADGTHAYFGYSRKNPNVAGAGTVRYRRTTNSGASWSSEKMLASSTWNTGSPSLFLQNSVLRAVYHRHRSTGFSVYYQQSGNGTSWSSAESVDTSGCCPYVTYAGKIIVLFTRGTTTANAVVRRGT
jgi:hypothetical protein